MANKTIPQLPEQTGKTDNDLLAIVDSGETTTSKIKVSTLLAGAGADYWNGITTGTTDNLISDFSSLDAAFTTNTIATDGTSRDSIVLGWNNSTTDNKGSYFFGNDITGTGVSIGTNLNNATDGAINIGANNTALKSDVCIGSSIVNTGNNPSSIAIGLAAKAMSFRGIGIGRLALNTGNVGLVVGYNSTNSASTGVVIGTGNDVSGGVGGAIFAGTSNDITSSGNYNTIIGGTGNLISGSVSGATILGMSSYTGAATDNAVYMESIVLPNYASYNFADDAAAATGGIPLGGIYHTSGALKVRIT